MHNIFIILGFLHCLVAMNVTAVDSIDRSTAFATELYRKCGEETPNKNIIISPYSISAALALLSQGAKNKTFRQIAQGLHLPNDKSAIAGVFAKQSQTFNKTIGASTLTIVNQIYVETGMPLKQSFKDVAVNSFKSGVESLDFNDREGAAAKINKFVENKTNGKIKDVMGGSLGQDVCCIILVNAIHFKADWETQFSESSTHKDNFFVDGEKTDTVDFMYRTGYVRYTAIDDLDATAVELNYINSNISLFVVLPNNPWNIFPFSLFYRRIASIDDLQLAITNYDLSKIRSQSNLVKVNLSLPKFKFEYRITLNTVLERMGMIDMFTTNADLSDQFDVPRQVKVSEVIHHAFIEVNEKGTEAAAATVVYETPYSSDVDNQVFEANHPFLFYIMDVEQNIVLFNGCYKGLN